MAGGVQDLWIKRDGTPSARHGRGLRYRVRYLGQTRSFRTKSAAEKYWAEITSDDAVRPSGVTVGDLLVRWREGKRGLSPRGYRACADAVSACTPWWGRPAQAVTRPEIQEWVATLTVPDGDTTRPASGSYRHKALQALRGALQVGVDTRQLSVNVADGVAVPPQHSRDQQYLSAAELWALADQMGHWRPMVLLLGTTGVRIGECVALTVGDVVPDRRRLRVRGATAKSRRFREVPLTGQVLDLLELGRAPGERLFVTERGRPVLVDNWRARVWRPVAPAGLRIHDLRHTAASLAIASGADVKAVQSMLGHKSAAMTLDRYAHLWDTGLDVVGDRMGQLLGTSRVHG